MNWSWLSRWLHWTMAVLLLGQIALGKYAEALALSPRKLEWMMWHKSVGICLLLLAVFRLGWNLSHPRPALAGTDWHQRLARASHSMLYGVMICLPLSGWILNSASNIPFKVFRVLPWPPVMGASETGAELAREVHESLVALFLLLLLMHTAAALYHHLVLKDRTLLQMLGWRG